MDEATKHRKATLLSLINERFDSNNASFATKIGRDKSRVTQLLDPGWPFGYRAALHIAQSLGLPDRFFELDFVGQAGAPPSSRKGVPVVGTAQLGDEGYFHELEYPTGHGDGFIDWPSQDPHAYALRCRGESMKPRIRHGEFVVIEPGKPVHPGDEVLVRAKDGRVMVGVSFLNPPRLFGSARATSL